MSGSDIMAIGRCIMVGTGTSSGIGCRMVVIRFCGSYSSGVVCGMIGIRFRGSCSSGVVSRWLLIGFVKHAAAGWYVDGY